MKIKAELALSLRKVNCIICGMDDTSVILKRSIFKSMISSLVKCILTEYYSIDSDGSYGRRITAQYGALTEERISWLSSELDRMEAHLSRISPALIGDKPIHFLEVGCALGHTLFCANLKGWTAMGVEPSTSAVNWIRQNYNLNVVNGTILEAAPHLPNDFDMVLMSHVLEHTLDPAAAIKAIYSLLSPGGIVLIYVPNGGGIQARYDFSKWEWMTFPDHLWYFTPATLRRLLENCNFVVDRVWTCIGHSNREQLFRLVKERLFLDSVDQAQSIVELLGPMCMLSDLRVIAVKQ
jgi:SAM-dependent methyltransferase